MKPSPGRAPTLRAAQQWMATLILDPQRRDAAPDHPELAAWFDPPTRGDLTERLHVYAAGYPARVHEALAETFPAIAHLVGHRGFADLAHRYADAVPLHSYNLSDAGARLPAFLRNDTLTADLPFLPDLARLEWHVARAFHAADEGQFDPAPLATWTLDDWEVAVLRFQPWVALIASEWPLRELWESRDTPIAQIDLDLRNHPDRVLVRRAGLRIHCESLDDAEAGTLTLLLEGTSVGGVVAHLTSRGVDPSYVSTWFARWMGLRLFSGCASAADPPLRIRGSALSPRG